MSNSKINDYLTKQLFIEKNIVTFRSLSRALDIHVNVAKNELAAYHASSRSCQTTPAAATYLITGEVAPLRSTRTYGESEDVDMDSDEGMESEEEVPLVKNILVGEDKVDDAKRKVLRMYSIFVYSLSPSPLRDAGHVCTPTEGLRQIDNKKGTGLPMELGKIVGTHVQMRKSIAEERVAPAIAGPSNVKSAPVVKPEPKVAKGTDKTGSKGEEQGTVKEKPVEKERSSGKLDWSRAKSKEVKDLKIKKEGTRKEIRVKDEPKEEEHIATSATSHKKSQEKPKRGIKRKSAVSALADTDTDSEPVQTSTASRTKLGARIKRGAVVSDSDEDISHETANKNGKAIDEDLKAMMDVDDDQVIRVSRPAPRAVKEEEEEGSDENVDMEDRTEVIPKPQRKKKVKTVIPVGKNGLKKKRIEKSRVTFDEKGYTATEDYSEYESVDEEEPDVDPEQAVRGKKKKPRESHVPGKEQSGGKPIKPTVSAKLKKTASGSGKGSIAGFFAPKK